MQGMYTFTIGTKAPNVICAVIEIPKGSHNKYEYDETLGVFTLDRVLSSPVHYPLDYGFIPETRSDDGDHLDILVLGGDPLFPGCVLEARPLGVLYMIDGGDHDFKILAVQEKNQRFARIHTLEDVKAHNEHLLDEIAHFFEVYKKLEKKQVQVGTWEGAERAKEEIKKAMEVYKRESRST